MIVEDWPKMGRTQEQIKDELVQAVRKSQEEK